MSNFRFKRTYSLGQKVQNYDVEPSGGSVVAFEEDVDNAAVSWHGSEHCSFVVSQR